MTEQKDHKQTRALTAERRIEDIPTLILRGLPGIGKTTLSNAIVETLDALQIRAFQINADVVRASVSKDLGFSVADRKAHAARMGGLAWLAKTNGCVPVVDFIMPTKATFDLFQDSLGSTNFMIVSIEEPGFESRFQDTKSMFQPMDDTWAGAVFGSDRFVVVNRCPESEIYDLASKIVKRLHSLRT
jgi:adenylylsulfate kinase-like enzyme